ncbi:sensor histidine kinase [Paenibacillus soyae]|uniref:histidine kinase n=1 Tax=Paenibacillus soyae TaxID=2969249 RepID=A0A9X2MNT3_9BACL|nr:HAMP domain-containing sensor histidine kinase [Paenibacillus soyae]MCR2803477.1 HAMP domain-containing histidine kinase [Paenibacillus soyae]
MNQAFRRVFAWLMPAMLLVLVALLPQAASAKEAAQSEMAIKEWQMLWEQPGEELNIEQVSSLPDGQGWLSVQAGGDYPEPPPDVRSAWIKLKLPELTQMRPALDMNQLFAYDVVIYLDGNIVYERYRDYVYQRNEILLPLGRSESSKDLYLKLSTGLNQLGFYQAPVIGEYDDFSKQYIIRDLDDLILGSSLIFIAFFMMASVLFLNRAFQPGWNSLFMVMLSVGVMILTYSAFLDKYFPEYGQLFIDLFDLASRLLMLSLFFFFEKIFGRGPFGLIRIFRNIQIAGATILIALLLLKPYSEWIDDLAGDASFLFFVFSIVVGNILILASLFYELRRKNREAIIMLAGIGLFAGIGMIEIAIYFATASMYKLVFWKFGVLFFLASLVILLVRKVMSGYKQALQYSKQIEIFNNQLQRSEKIELISHLAASIAHEVRNPLQVTRGFLQLLGEKASDNKAKDYMSLAINELDRASEIITDFLTFAKPDQNGLVKLDTIEEVQQIVAILSPLATMQGGILKIQGEKNLYVRGNSSRFKQALINIIKNSIEALGENGEVEIAVAKEKELNTIIIVIRDNGEGIDNEDLQRLGEPYYSKKTKGTGLGLMVTYRIIESMNGEIAFSSTKGMGTEVCIRIPQAM